MIMMTLCPECGSTGTEQDQIAYLEGEIERLRAALSDIAHSGPVDEEGQPDSYAGWSWCYDRATKALKEPPVPA